MEFGYCPECGKEKRVIWEEQIDVTGEKYWNPICFYCGETIVKCHNCKFLEFEEFQNNLPMLKLKGYCSKIRAKKSPFSLACKHFKIE